MFKKECPYCGRTSYDNSEVELWCCQYCDTPLMDVAAEPVDIAECFWCGEKMVRLQDGQMICPECGWRYQEGGKVDGFYR